jgi:hypothetical protein
MQGTVAVTSEGLVAKVLQDITDLPGAARSYRGTQDGANAGAGRSETAAKSANATKAGNLQEAMA